MTLRLPYGPAAHGCPTMSQTALPTGRRPSDDRSRRGARRRRHPPFSPPTSPRTPRTDLRADWRKRSSWAMVPRSGRSLRGVEMTRRCITVGSVRAGGIEHRGPQAEPLGPYLLPQRYLLPSSRPERTLKALPPFGRGEAKSRRWERSDRVLSGCAGNGVTEYSRGALGTE
jgi:hypothetical protein